MIHPAMPMSTREAESNSTEAVSRLGQEPVTQLLLSLFSATASRTRFFSAPSLILSFSLMSMARLTFPSRLELNRPEGSFKAAPLKNVSLTTFL